MSDNDHFNTASQAVSQLLWTFSNDLCNVLVERGVSKELLNETTDEILRKYVDSGIKLKPAVTARTKREKPTTTSNTIMNLVKSKKNINIHTANWVDHPDDPALKFTRDIKLHTGRYPIIKENKLVLTADDKGSYEPSPAEFGEAQIYGIV